MCFIAPFGLKHTLEALRPALDFGLATTSTPWLGKLRKRGEVGSNHAAAEPTRSRLPTRRARRPPAFVVDADIAFVKRVGAFAAPPAGVGSRPG